MGIVQDGLYLWYDGIDNAGIGIHDDAAAVWKDLSGNDRDGVIAGGAAWRKQCLAFNGSDSWVNCGVFNPSYATIDVIAEYNTIVTPEGNAIASSWESGGLGIYQYNSAHSFGFYVDSNWSAANGKAIEKHKIVHLTATYDGTNAKLYEDGVLVGNTVKSGTLRPAANNTVFSIGSNPTGTYRGSMPLFGYVYAVRLYNRALTADEVLVNHQHDAERFTDHANFNLEDRYHVTGAFLLSVADSIRNSKKTIDTYTPEQMAQILSQTL